MKEELPDYAKYFAVGLRVEVRFPRSHNTTFHDWAIIKVFDEDLLVLQLSRDTLPDGIRTDTGTILDIRVGKDGYAYYCRGIIVAEEGPAHLSVRLISDVIPDELREFYRIDVHIPLTYTIPVGKSAEQIHQEWHERRYPPPPPEDGEEEEVPVAPPPPPLPPVAANISGSGIRIKMHEKLPADTLVPLHLHLPLDQPREIEIIGKVVDVIPLHTREGAPPLFSTGLHFLHIDERDRDAIVQFVAVAQMERLRELRQGNVSLTSLAYSSYAEQIRRRRILAAFTLFILMAVLVTGLIYWQFTAKKGEIERTYEREIRKYRDALPLK